MVNPSKGVRLGVDVGSVRIGISRCDQDQIMAMPVATLKASENNINEVISFAQEFGAQLIYVGKPISLNENVTSSTLLAEEFANRLAMQWEQPVRLLDERLTTVSATNTLQVNGKNSKEGRSIIDQVAAVILLDHALAIEKSLGDFAGQVVKSPEDK